MQELANESILRAILHSLPNAVIALNDSDIILVSNSGASKLLQTKRDHLEGGSIYRYLQPGENISNTANTVIFNTSNGNISLTCISKEIQVDDESIKVILLKEPTNETSTLLNTVKEFSNSDLDPYQKLCDILIEEKIAADCQIVAVNGKSAETIAWASSNPSSSSGINSSTPTIEISIDSEDKQKIQLVIVPSSTHGLNKNDLDLIDLFKSLIHLKVNNDETSSDASGSEAALALALKSGAMGLCFFDLNSQDCYLSDRLANWSGLNPEKFDGKLISWLQTFIPEDTNRVTELFSKLQDQTSFRTLVNLKSLEDGDKRLEISGRPINESDKNQWVAIIKDYKDENEVEAAWKTRIAMEEAARIEAENSLVEFENVLHDTLLPTTSDVTIVHSRQDAGTFHIVRPINESTSLYGVGAITTNSRTQAVVGAAIVATIADVLASKTQNVEEYVKLIRDHARARDIETSMSAVLVTNETIHSASIGGASVYISGKQFSGTLKVTANTAISLSSHSEASPDSVEVAANGRPWKIMTSVIETLSHIETNNDLNENIISLDDEYSGAYKSPIIKPIISVSEANTKGYDKDDEDAEKEDLNISLPANENVRAFRSGTITPS
ncbi:MAG: hypothetical protein KBF89_05580 [Acidimicrobiia bacterium]|nr:hypothetical protein [Acidimicrobiia bacterium]